MNMNPTNLIKNILNRNPIFSMLQNGGNPQQFIQNMIQQNPAQANQLNMIQNMIAGKNPQQLKETVMNLCKERGVSPEQIINNLAGNNQG